MTISFHFQDHKIKEEIFSECLLNLFREDQVQRTLAIIKPDAFKHSTEIKKLIAENGFLINKSTRYTLNKEQATLFYFEHKGKVKMIFMIYSGTVINKILIGLDIC